MFEAALAGEISYGQNMRLHFLQPTLNGDEIEDLQKMGFDFGRFVSDLQY